MIQKINKISDLPILSKVINYGKTIIASDKKNYQIELRQIKGKKITHSEEELASHDDGERKNVIRLDFDTGEHKYFTVYNGTDGDKGKTGDVGPQGDKGESFNKREMINRAGDALTIANDDITDDATAVWSAYRGKVMEDFLRSISEVVMTDEEYQLLFNDDYDEYGRENAIHQVFIDLEFATKTDNQTTALIHKDNKSYKTYIKYWTYEDDGDVRYYIKVDENTFIEAPTSFDIWNDLYLNPDNNNEYYTRKLIITEINEITGEVISSEWQYTKVSVPVWLDLEFTTTIEDETSILLNNDTYSDDGEVSKEHKEEEIVIIHRPITSISIDGNDHIKLPINSILTKAIIIQPTDYLNSPICIDYDETKIKVFEDGRIMALANNCETEIKIYSEENPSIFAIIYVNVVTYVEKIEFNVQSIKAFKGYEQTISTTITPESASNKIIEWSSSNDEIATVDENGKITLLEEGQVTIYAAATDGSGVVSRIDVTVDTAVSNIIVEDSYEILVGKPTIIEASVLPENASNKGLIWTTNTEGISVQAAEDGTNGQIYLSSKINGTVTITPDDGSNISKTINIIGKYPVTSIMLNETNVNLDLGESIQLTPTVNSNADNQELIWESSNDAIATVDQNGFVRTVAGGTVTITCSSTDGYGTKATCQITSTVLITNIVLDQNINLYAGNTYNINYDIEPLNANNRILIWYTSDPEVISVNNNIITGLKEGNVKVYAMANDNSGVIASANVNVIIPTSELLLSDDELTLNIDDTYTLIATVVPDETTNQNLIYQSLDESIAHVDNNGNITAISKGTTSIFVKTTDGTTNSDNTPLSKECIVNVL